MTVITDMQKEYWDTIVSYAIKELKAGRTPNSDMFCNRLIKFGIFFDKIDNSFEKIASGHYAQIQYENNKYYLKTKHQIAKDRSPRHRISFQYLVCFIQQVFDTR